MRETGREKERRREEEKRELRSKNHFKLTHQPTCTMLSHGWTLNVDLHLAFSRVDGPSDLSPGKIYAQLNLGVVNFLFVCFLVRAGTNLNIFPVSGPYRT